MIMKTPKQKNALFRRVHITKIDLNGKLELRSNIDSAAPRDAECQSAVTVRSPICLEVGTGTRDQIRLMYNPRGIVFSSKVLQCPRHSHVCPGCGVGRSGSFR